MTQRSAIDQFEPDPEQLALLPDVSGNALNGYGEAEPRRPTPIYWHPADTIPHGEIMQWFYRQNDAPEVLAKRDEAIQTNAQPLPNVAEVADPAHADELTHKVKSLAVEYGASHAGITRLDPEFVFEGYEIDFPTIIVLAVEPTRCGAVISRKND